MENNQIFAVFFLNKSMIRKIEKNTKASLKWIFNNFFNLKRLFENEPRKTRGAFKHDKYVGGKQAKSIGRFSVVAATPACEDASYRTQQQIPGIGFSWNLDPVTRNTS